MTSRANSSVSRRAVLIGGVGAATGAALAGAAPPAFAATARSAAAPPGADPTRGKHKYFSFDTGLWNGHLMSNCQVSMGKFEKDTSNNPLFGEGLYASPSLPWEPRFDNGYPNVFWDPGARKYRCYYTLFIVDPSSSSTPVDQRPGKPYSTEGRVTGCGYAESADGVHWTKPALGIVDFNGSTANNLLLKNVQGTSVLHDPGDPDPSRRYKLLTLASTLSVAFSADGIHFTPLQPWPANSPAPGADCHNRVFKDSVSGDYVLITRLWDNNIRVVAMARSRDFISWSKPVEVHRGNGLEAQTYSMPSWEYGEGLYLGLDSVYTDGDDTLPDYDTVSLALQWSTNITEWNDVAPDDSTFIPHGPGMGQYPRGAFDSSVIFASVPVETGDRLWFYYMGGKGLHTSWRQTALGRGWIQKDKFACYGSRVAHRPAMVTTQGLDFYGDDLRLLADIDHGGSVSVALTDQNGTVVQPGFGADRSLLTPGPDGWHQVHWRGADVRSLTPGAFYALRITLRNTRLWAIGGDFYVRPLKYAKP
ncbi:hypothetical protein G3I19_13575 [Streptomyces sp. SID10853]|uniref:hypothetical protein n=1 Tax=Streptomyces sp. SID10853 TaxID=2706028 RepID=UPI0013BF30C8|nr:hypothetical protein [Streptomyces sp. SID10853]NDZ79530.1 hypothetical protein [Streptomyces sp. SID10853]